MQMKYIKLKNLLILFNFFSILLLGALVYILSERVAFQEEKERILNISMLLLERENKEE